MTTFSNTETEEIWAYNPTRKVIYKTGLATPVAVLVASFGEQWVVYKVTNWRWIRRMFLLTRGNNPDFEFIDADSSWSKLSGSIYNSKLGISANWEVECC